MKHIALFRLFTSISLFPLFLTMINGSFFTSPDKPYNNARNDNSSPSADVAIYQVSSTSTDTPTSTPTNTAVPSPTNTATSTAILTSTSISSATSTSTKPGTPTNTLQPTQSSFVRPVLVIANYWSEPAQVNPGDSVNLALMFKNSGVKPAKFIKIDFPSGDFVPLGNGGTVYIQEIPSTETSTIRQVFSVSNTLSSGVKSIEVEISYLDLDGNAYSDTLAVAINVYQPATPVPSNNNSYVPATPTVSGGPQLIISSFNIALQNSTSANDQFLQPGSIFVLTLNATNIGTEKASRILAVLGGADASGTGLSGEANDFSAFSPVNASNFIPLPDIDPGGTQQLSQQIIVNAAAQSGSYNLPISFVYHNQKGDKTIDDQLISLQVLVFPKIELGLFAPIDSPVVGQQITIPLMITNLSPEIVQLGQLEISCPNWSVSPLSVYIGKIEGGEQWFPPGEIVGVPQQAGESVCAVTINYQDDFGQRQKLVDNTVTLNAQEAILFEEPVQGIVEPVLPTKESGWKMFIRVLLGFLGFDGGAENVTPIPVQDPAKILSTPSDLPVVPAKP